MAAVNTEEIGLAYEAACRLAREENDGVLDTVTEMALGLMATSLLESLLSEAANYKKSAEKRMLKAEEALSRLGYFEDPTESDAELFTTGKDAV